MSMCACHLQLKTNMRADDCAGLMDVGVGSFIVASGLVADGGGSDKEKRSGPRTAIQPIISLITLGNSLAARLTSVSRICPHAIGQQSRCFAVNTDAYWCQSLPAGTCCTAGLLRLLFTRWVDYQQPVGEYGVHWNFFFTLAAVRLLTAAVPIPAVAALYAGECTHEARCAQLLVGLRHTCSARPIKTCGQLATS